MAKILNWLIGAFNASSASPQLKEVLSHMVNFWRAHDLIARKEYSTKPTTNKAMTTRAVEQVFMDNKFISILPSNYRSYIPDILSSLKKINLIGGTSTEDLTPPGNLPPEASSTGPSTIEGEKPSTTN